MNNSESRLKHFCETVIAPNAFEINLDPTMLKKTFTSLISESITSETQTFSNADLEEIYGASPALGFTLWQNLAAVERLSNAREWISDNVALWRQLRTFELTCGLATTHLGRKTPLVTARSIDGGFLLTGKSPWVCGYELFDKLIVGFEHGLSQITFALIDFPGTNRATRREAKIERLELSTFIGTSTVSIEFNDFQIASNQIISSRSIDDVPPIRRPSAYTAPELGMAKSALREARVRCDSRDDLILICNTIEARIDAADADKNSSTPSAELTFQVYEVVKAAIELLSLVSGGRALNKRDLTSRLNSDVLLLNAVLQNEATFKAKCARV